MKSVNLSVLPNYVVWFVGVDVESVLPCRSDPLGRYGDESEQKTLDSVCGLDSKMDSHKRHSHDVSVEVCSHGGDKQEHAYVDAR